MVEQVLLNLLDKMGKEVGSTKLVKLCYLADYVHYQHYGETMTGLEYFWDDFGPAKGHTIIRTAADMLGVERTTRPVMDYTAAYFRATAEPPALPTADGDHRRCDQPVRE